MACSGPIGPRSKSRRRVGQRPRRIAVEPVAMRDLDRLGRVGGVTLIGRAPAPGPWPAEQQRRLRLRDRADRASPGVAVSTEGRRAAADPDRPAGAQRGDRPLDRAGASAHTASSQDQRHMVRRPLPAAAGLEHAVRDGAAAQGSGEHPHMVEPAAAVARRPVLGAIAPPGEVALGRGDEPAAKVDPVVRLPAAGSASRPRSAYG